MSIFKKILCSNLGLATTGIVVGIAITVAVLFSLNAITSSSPREHNSNLTKQNESVVSREDLNRVTANDTLRRERDPGILKFLSQAPSVFERTEALYSLLLSADAKILADLLKQSQNIGSEHLQHTTQTAIVQRFAAVDATMAISTIRNLPSDRHSPLITAFFREFARIDINDAVTHAKTLADSKKLAAMQGIIAFQKTLSDKEMEGLTREIQIDLSAFEEGVFFSSIESEWQNLVEDDQSNVAQTAQLIRLAHKWVDGRGLEAIAQIDSSLNDSVLKQAVLGSILQQAILEDPSATMLQVLNFENELRTLAMEMIARAWASIGPKEAMDSILVIESPKGRRQMLEYFVTAWANYDPKALFEQFELIPENLRAHAEEHALRKLISTTPEETMQYLSKVSDEYLKFELTMDLAVHWSDKNALEALNWALAEEFSSDALRRQVLNTVLRSLANENPELALQTALDQPTDMIGLGLEITVIEQVARTDIERALSILAQVREGISQSFATVAVGKALVRNNELDRALELAQQLPEQDRDLYYNLIVNEWAYADPKSLVNNIEALPSKEAQYTAAMDLTRLNVGRNILTKEQMSVVRNFLPDDYNFETGRRGTESARYARLNNLQNKELTEEERKQLQNDVHLLIMEGQFRRYSIPLQ